MTDLIATMARRASADPGALLAETPWLGAAIDSDARAGRFTRWGWSTVMDEHVGGAVVPQPLFDALHARAGIPVQWPHGNAGLLHTYGYLLSEVPTPYGLKRERWLGDALAGAYGLPATAFVPWLSPRTLLERVTDAADGVRLRGTLREAAVAGVATTLSLSRSAPDGPWALVYAVDDRLITTFPIAERETVLEEWDAEAPRLRWNAVEPRQS